MNSNIRWHEVDLWLARNTLVLEPQFFSAVGILDNCSAIPALCSRYPGCGLDTLCLLVLVFLWTHESGFLSSPKLSHGLLWQF